MTDGLVQSAETGQQRTHQVVEDNAVEKGHPGTKLFDGLGQALQFAQGHHQVDDAFRGWFPLDDHARKTERPLVVPVQE